MPENLLGSFNLILCFLQVSADLSPSTALKLIYSDGYVLSESANAIVSYERNEFGLQFYLFSQNATGKAQRVLIGDRTSDDMRTAKLNFVIESLSGKDDLATKAYSCNESSSPLLRHLIRFCVGYAKLRELTDQENSQMEEFKRASKGKPVKMVKAVVVVNHLKFTCDSFKECGTDLRSFSLQFR